MRQTFVDCRERHQWERRVENHDGAECVVRVCEHCGLSDIVWSRRGFSEIGLQTRKRPKNRLTPADK